MDTDTFAGHDKSMNVSHDQRDTIVKGTRMKPQMRYLGAAVALGDPQEGGNKTPVAVRRKRADGNGYEYTGKINVLEGRNSRKRSQVRAWRDEVRESIKVSPLWEHRVIANPVVVRWHFTMKAPQRIPADRHGFPAVKPDVDKLVRATCDAVTDSGLWKDDGLIISEIISKAYVNGFHADGTSALEIPGCVIHVYEILSPVA